MNNDLPYYIALSQAPGIGQKRFSILVEHFKSAEKVWKADENLLKEILDKSIFERFRAFRQSQDPQSIVDTIYKKDIKFTTLLDKNYPKKLREIFDPPPVLYFKGEILPEDDFALAVVGTRRVTNYGREVTESLVRDLAGSKLTIVSGLARGVDTIAHQTALQSGQRTIAVLGSGVDIIYPAENSLLAREIIKKGALVSEITPGIAPSKGYFPARNRIISGLSQGVLITEADEKSGSLITASLALEQNREVFAVPGPIYSQLSKGPVGLIKQGAKLVTSVDDIFEELNLVKKLPEKSKKSIIAETKDEELIIKILADEPKHIDQILRESKLSSDTLNSLLITMELKSKLKNLGNGTYSLNI